MPATHEAFEHFVRTGELAVSILPPEVDMENQRKFKPGDIVEFDPYDGDTGFKLNGKILNYLPPDGKGFKGGYHIACYYVVGEKDLRLETPAPNNESPGETWARLSKEGKTETQIATYLGISVEALRGITSGYSAL